MIKAPQLADDAILTVIRTYEDLHGVTLCIEDFDFLTFAIKEFITKAIDKFVSGAAQHNSSGENPFLSIDHQTESEKEIYDLWFYNQGRKLKERKCKHT